MFIIIPSVRERRAMLSRNPVLNVTEMDLSSLQRRFVLNELTYLTGLISSCQLGNSIFTQGRSACPDCKGAGEKLREKDQYVPSN